MSKPLLIMKFLSHSKRSLTKSKTRAIYTILVEKIAGAAFAIVVEVGTLVDFLVCKINAPSLRGKHA